MTEKEMIQCAIDEGFSAAAIVDTRQIVFDPSFRPYCEENLCGQYGANYACPPDCGSPEEMKQRILAHKKALVLQTIWQVADYSDVPAIKHAKKFVLLLSPSAAQSVWVGKELKRAISRHQKESPEKLCAAWLYEPFPLQDTPLALPLEDIQIQVDLRGDPQNILQILK